MLKITQSQFVKCILEKPHICQIEAAVALWLACSLHTSSILGSSLAPAFCVCRVHTVFWWVSTSYLPQSKDMLLI